MDHSEVALPMLAGLTLSGLLTFVVLGVVVAGVAFWWWNEQNDARVTWEYWTAELSPEEVVEHFALGMEHVLSHSGWVDELYVVEHRSGAWTYGMAVDVRPDRVVHARVVPLSIVVKPLPAKFPIWRVVQDPLASSSLRRVERSLRQADPNIDVHKRREPLIPRL